MESESMSLKCILKAKPFFIDLRTAAQSVFATVHEHPRDAKQSIVSGFKIKIAPVHSDFDVAFFPLSLMGFAD